MFTNENYDMDVESTRVETLIGHSVRVEGEMTSRGNITIDGEFSGTLKVGGKLTVGKDAKLDAEVTAHEAFIAGTLKGNITVEERLELSGDAEINGDVTAGTLVMEAGASLNGTCKMGKVAVSNSAKQENSHNKNEESDTKDNN